MKNLLKKVFKHWEMFLVIFLILEFVVFGAANPKFLRPQSITFDFTASYVRLVADTAASGETPGVRGIGTGKVNALASFDVTYK